MKGHGLCKKKWAILIPGLEVAIHRSPRQISRGIKPPTTNPLVPQIANQFKLGVDNFSFPKPCQGYCCVSRLLEPNFLSRNTDRSSTRYRSGLMIISRHFSRVILRPITTVPLTVVFTCTDATTWLQIYYAYLPMFFDFLFTCLARKLLISVPLVSVSHL